MIGHPGQVLTREAVDERRIVLSHLDQVRQTFLKGDWLLRSR
jgi:hypothetical protein